MKDTNVFNFTEIVSVFVSFKIFKESLTYLFSAYTSVKFSPILLVTRTKLHNKHSALKINLTYRHYFISGKGETSHYFFFGLIEKIILLSWASSLPREKGLFHQSSCFGHTQVQRQSLRHAQCITWSFLL